MSKTITSPIPRFPGTVTLSDPMMLPQAIAWERARERADEMLEFATDENGEIIPGSGKFKAGIMPSEREAALLEGMRPTIEAWNLEGVDPEHFPFTPKADVTRLITWLMNEVGKVYYGEADEHPNA